MKTIGFIPFCLYTYRHPASNEHCLYRHFIVTIGILDNLTTLVELFPVVLYTGKEKCAGEFKSLL